MKEYIHIALQRQLKRSGAGHKAMEIYLYLHNPLIGMTIEHLNRAKRNDPKLSIFPVQQKFNSYAKER